MHRQTFYVINDPAAVTPPPLEQDQIAPLIVTTNFKNNSVLIDSPLNPTLKFQFSEPVEMYIKYIGGTIDIDARPNISFVGSSSLGTSHELNVNLLDTNHVNLDSYGLLTVHFEFALLVPGMTYTMTIPFWVFRDLGVPTGYDVPISWDRKGVPGYQYTFTTGIISSVSGVQYLVPYNYTERKQSDYFD